jgi:excisionase family DNA binding protein
MNDDEMLTSEEVAAFLKVTPATVRRWIREGQLEGYEFGKVWRVSRKQLSEFMDKNRGKG